MKFLELKALETVPHRYIWVNEKLYIEYRIGKILKRKLVSTLPRV